jgi:hypothetical protein
VPGGVGRTSETTNPTPLRRAFSSELLSLSLDMRAKLLPDRMRVNDCPAVPTRCQRGSVWVLDANLEHAFIGELMDVKASSYLVL